MIESSDRCAAPQLQALSRGLGAAVAALGVLVLYAWAYDYGTLRALTPGSVSMKANTALGFILLGMTLWFRERRRLVTALASVAVLAAAATLAEYAAGADFGIDQLLFADPGDAFTSHLGRMSPVTAVAFILVAAAQLLPRGWKRSAEAGQSMLLVVMLLGFASLLGRLFEFGRLDSLWGFTHMAAYTAAAFAALALGALLAAPRSGWMAVLTSDSIAGSLARRALPFAVGLPLLGNVLRAVGERAGWLDHDTSVYLLVTAGSVTLMLGTIAAALAMRRLDGERRQLDLQLARQQELDSLRRAFLSAVSHELRSPLGAIAMFSELAQSQLDGREGGEAKAREHLEHIDANAARLSGFINDLLLLSSVESRKLVLDPRPLRLQDLVGELLDAYGKAGSIRGIRIGNRVGSDLPPVLADAPHVGKALSHLLSNALKFTPAGGAVDLASSVDHGARKIELRVSNSGEGLDEEALRLLFQGFQQGANINGRHSGTQGVGIGLHLVKALIEANGGEARAESRVGKETTFILTLPMAPASGAPA